MATISVDNRRIPWRTICYPELRFWELPVLHGGGNRVGFHLRSAMRPWRPIPVEYHPQCQWEEQVQVSLVYLPSSYSLLLVYWTRWQHHRTPVRIGRDELAGHPVSYHRPYYTSMVFLFFCNDAVRTELYMWIDYTAGVWPLCQTTNLLICHMWDIFLAQTLVHSQQIRVLMLLRQHGHHDVFEL